MGADQEHRPVPDYAFRISLLAFFGHALAHIFLILIAPIEEQIGDSLSLPVERVVIAYWVINGLVGFGAIPAGWLAARFGEQRIYALYFLGLAVGGALTGLAQSWWMFLSGSAVLGLATSVYHPVGITLLSKGVRGQGRAMGINGVAGTLGTALGPIFAARLAAGASWRWAFLLLVFPSIILWLQTQFQDLGPAGKPEPSPPPRSEGSVAGPIPQVPRRLVVFFIFIFLSTTLAGFTFQLVTSMLPKAFAGGRILPGVLSIAGDRTTIALLFGVLGQLGAGFLADRFDNRRLYLAILAIGALAVFPIGWLSGSPLLALAALAATLIFALQPVENTLISLYTPHHWRSFMYGIKFMPSFGVGSLGIWIGPQLYERSGLAAVFATAAATLAAAAAATLIANLIPVERPVPPPRISSDPPPRTPAPRALQRTKGTGEEGAGPPGN